MRSPMPHAQPAVTLTSVVARLHASRGHETIQEMLRAANERYWDGYALATMEPQRNTAAIYMFGYVVEILLKTAYAQLNGAVASTPMDSYLGSVRQDPMWSGGTLHRIDLWFYVIAGKRASKGMANHPARFGALRSHVLNAYSQWSEALLYSGYMATESELISVSESMEWIRGNYRLLWR